MDKESAYGQLDLGNNFDNEVSIQRFNILPSSSSSLATSLITRTTPFPLTRPDPPSIPEKKNDE